MEGTATENSIDHKGSGLANGDVSENGSNGKAKASESVSMKRPFEGSDENQPEQKKMAADGDYASEKATEGSTHSRDSSHTVSGESVGPGGDKRDSTQGTMKVPSSLVGLHSGSSERMCTLTGTYENIERAKQTIQGLVDKMSDEDNNPQAVLSAFNSQESQVEINIPGPKVGLVIGKGGETIKMLQERQGVKIVVIQDTNTVSHTDKPLRITGNRLACLRTKDMILQLMAEKDMDGVGYQPGMSGQYQGNKRVLEIQVPKSVIGIIIGKGGEMIKRIQDESGSRIQFKPDDDPSNPHRVCTIAGDDRSNQVAGAMIQELIEHRQAGGKDWGPNRFQPDVTQYSVPADKCGLIIGKGGETIKEINRMSGAHVELNRDSAADKFQRLFRLRGNPEQIQHAIALMHEKMGIPLQPTGPMGMPGMPMGGPMGPMGPMPGGPMMPNPYGPPVPQPMPQQMPAASYAQPWPQPVYPQAQQTPVQYGAPAAAGGQGAPAGAPVSNDPSKQQVTDPNAAAWAAYYAQYYGQQPAVAAQPVQAAPQPVAYTVPAGSAPNPAVQQQPQPSYNQATGQVDYSAAWAEYYRQQGMHQQAAAILAGQQPQPS